MEQKKRLDSSQSQAIPWSTRSNHLNLVSSLPDKAPTSESADQAIPLEAPTTKRQLLHMVASLFEPLGLVLQCTGVVTGKIILQAVRREGGAWDDGMSKVLK